MSEFVLHSRLEADTTFVADWSLSRVLAMNDARYPWLVLVPQLHIHIVARNPGDFAWPGPVWGQDVAQPYEPAALAAFVARLRTGL